MTHLSPLPGLDQLRGLWVHSMQARREQAEVVEEEGQVARDGEE